MAFNIGGGHAFGIHGKYLFFHILADAGLILLDDLRLELALSVTGN